MRNIIAISGKTIVAAIARRIRNVLSITKMHGHALRLESWFLLQRLAGTAMAQRVTVPVCRQRAVVGVTGRSPAMKHRRFMGRVTGFSFGPQSWDVVSRF